MDFKLIKELSTRPSLYQRGTSVMWTDPHISKQLLECHINPDNDLASRNPRKIEGVVNWILGQTNKPEMEILDLGCGPGLYAELFAQMEHAVTGVDFSENSIAYARKQANEKHLKINYLNQDYLNLDFFERFDLVILIYLDFCVLLPEARDRVLKNIHKALKKGGLFICDIVNEKNIDKKVTKQSWEVQEAGFWRNSPYIALTNGYHYPEAKVLGNHHMVIGEDNSVDTYIFWTHYYERQDFISLLNTKGFTGVKYHDNVLPDTGDCWNGENVTFYVSRKE